MISAAEGRWAGALTSRPLPEHDETLEKLTPAQRHELSIHWLQRAASEERVGRAFAFVHGVLGELQAAPELVALAARAVDDERRHTELSLLVARRFAQTALTPLSPLPLTVPRHPQASATLEKVLWVLGQCAFNETFASSVLEHALRAATGPLAKAALRELLSDEVDHARLGWAFLSSLEPSARAQVGPWLLALAQANLRAWRTTPREYPSDVSLVSQGALSLELLETALRDAISSLLIPGFAELQLDVEDLKRWLDAGAPT